MAIKTYSDTDLNDSDKTLTVPAGKHWRVQAVFVDLTTTATVGDRRLLVEWRDASGNTICHVMVDAVQAASKTYHYSFGPGFPTLATVVVETDTYVMVAMPKLFMPAAYDLRVRDIAAVDAIADDMTIRALVDEFAYGG